MATFFDRFQEISHDLLNHGIDEGGKTGAKIARRKFRQQSPSRWGNMKPTVGNVSGKQLTLGNVKQQFGERLDRDGMKMRPENMISLIKWYLDEDNNLAVIMGRHPSFTPVKFKDGKRLGRQGQRVWGTNKGLGKDDPNDIINIFQKLDEGKTVKLTKKQQWLLSNTIVVTKTTKSGNMTGYKPFIKFKNGKAEPMIKEVKYKKTGFAQSAQIQSQSIVPATTVSIYNRYFKNATKEIQ